jgi:hypothetical protein
VFRRPVLDQLLGRLREPRRFLQVLAGPRQTGKTTLARQALEEIGVPGHYASADEPAPRDRSWVAQQWDLARLRAAARQAAGARGRGAALLVLDEVQKVPEWSGVVKRLWDEDTARRVPLKVVLLGSAPLLVQRGLAESLAGRFELVPVTHWSFPEMRDAFGLDVDHFVFFGGYPGAAPLLDSYDRWSRYILDSLIETTVARDVLLMTRVDKPALLRQLFHLGCAYSGQILSFQKMLGQLHDAGNTVTLAHYLELLSGAGMLTGLPKYAGRQLRQRGSSPKLQVLNAALATAQAGIPFEAAREDREHWGRLVESAVGAHLVNTARGTAVEVSYWRERGREVDFVLRAGRKVVALEVKSGRRPTSLPGLDAFTAAFSPTRRLLVGGGGIPVAEFLAQPATYWVA